MSNAESVEAPAGWSSPEPGVYVRYVAGGRHARRAHRGALYTRPLYGSERLMGAQSLMFDGYVVCVYPLDLS